MRRFPAACTALTITIIALLALTACGGGDNNTTTTPPSKIVLSPASLSLTVGQIKALTVADGNGNAITQAITWKVVDPANPGNASPFASVSNSGMVCAGSWNSPSAPTDCTPNTQNNGGVGQANIIAVIGDVSSDPVTVYTHAAANHVGITSPGIDLENCLSQTKTATYTATADVPNIGVFTWQSTNTAVATVDTNGVVTAVGPGQAQIVASVVNGTSNVVTSTPATFTTCPVAKIQIHTQNAPATETSVTLATSGTATAVADITDVKGNAVSNTSLGWTGSTLAVATVATGGITAINPGTTTVAAYCSAATGCNAMLPGVSPIAIYSNPYIVSVTGTSSTSVWAASSASNSLVPIDATTNTAATALALKDANGNAVTPNSMMFSSDGSTLYIGTSGGLMTIAATTTTPSIGVPATQMPGKVLAVSRDGTMVFTTDGTQVYIQTTTSSSSGTSVSYSTLALPGVRAALYTPDASKLYFIGTNAGGDYWTVWSTSITPVQHPLANASDISFALNGGFGFIAGPGNAVSATSVCNDLPYNIVASTAAAPIALRALANGTQILALDPPYVSLITANSDNVGCSETPRAPALTLAAKDTLLRDGGFGAPSLGLKQPQLIVSSDGTRAFVTSNTPGVLLGYDAVKQVSAPIQLQGGITETYTGGITLDGAQLYVGVGGPAPSVHRIDLASGLDVQEIPVGIKASDGTTLAPDLVAVRPK